MVFRPVPEEMWVNTENSSSDFMYESLTEHLATLLSIYENKGEPCGPCQVNSRVAVKGSFKMGPILDGKLVVFLICK